MKKCSARCQVAGNVHPDGEQVVSGYCLPLSSLELPPSSPPHTIHNIFLTWWILTHFLLLYDRHTHRRCSGLVKCHVPYKNDKITCALTDKQVLSSVKQKV